MTSLAIYCFVKIFKRFYDRRKNQPVRLFDASKKLDLLDTLTDLNIDDNPNFGEYQGKVREEPKKSPLLITSRIQY